MLDKIYENSAANKRTTLSPYCKPIMDPQISIKAWLAGTTILFVVPARQATYIGWQNRFLGSLNVYKHGLCFNQRLGIPSIKEDRRGEKVNPL
jgi:hypothetical protein